MRGWSASILQYAFKSASPGKKRTLGAHSRPKTGMAASHPVDPGPLEMAALSQSDVRGGSKPPRGRLKTRSRSALISQCAIKSASPGEKRTLGAKLRPKPGLAASHPVDPGPFEMTTTVQSGECGGSKTPWQRLKARAWRESIPQYAFKSASQGEKRPLGAQLRHKPGLAVSNPVDPSSLEKTEIARSDGTHASPSMLSILLLQVKNTLPEPIYDQNRTWPPRTR